jgi:hypothetical protein
MPATLAAQGHRSISSPASVHNRVLCAATPGRSSVITSRAKSIWLDVLRFSGGISQRSGGVPGK